MPKMMRHSTLIHRVSHVMVAKNWSTVLGTNTNLRAKFL